MKFYYDKNNNNRWIDEPKGNFGETEVEPKIVDSNDEIEYIFFDEVQKVWVPVMKSKKLFYNIYDGKVIEGVTGEEDYVTDKKPPKRLKYPKFVDGKWVENENRLKEDEFNEIVKKHTIKIKGHEVVPDDFILNTARAGLNLMKKMGKKEGVLPIGQGKQIKVGSLEEAEKIYDEIEYNNYLMKLKASKIT